MPEEFWVGRYSKFFSLAPSVALAELRRMPVGYLDDVMLFQEFAQAWATFSKAEGKDQEKMAEEHPLYDVCRDILYEKQKERLQKARKDKNQA